MSPPAQPFHVENRSGSQPRQLTSLVPKHGTADQVCSTALHVPGPSNPAPAPPAPAPSFLEPVLPVPAPSFLDPALPVPATSILPLILRNDSTEANYGSGERTGSSCGTKVSALPVPAPSLLPQSLPTPATSILPLTLSNDATEAKHAAGEITGSSCCTKESALPVPAPSFLDPALPVQNTSNDSTGTTNAAGENTASSFNNEDPSLPVPAPGPETNLSIMLTADSDELCALPVPVRQDTTAQKEAEDAAAPETEAHGNTQASSLPVPTAGQESDPNQNPTLQTKTDPASPETVSNLPASAPARTTERKRHPLNERPIGTSVEEVRSFLEHCAFARRNIKDSGAYRTLLSSLTRKGAVFSWGPEKQKAFEALRDGDTPPPAQAEPAVKTTVPTLLVAAAATCELNLPPGDKDALPPAATAEPMAEQAVSAPSGPATVPQVARPPADPGHNREPFRIKDLNPDYASITSFGPQAQTSGCNVRSSPQTSYGPLVHACACLQPAHAFCQNIYSPTRPEICHMCLHSIDYELVYNTQKSSRD